MRNKVEEIDARSVSRFSLGTPGAGEHLEEVFVRVGKYGPFVEQGERRASIPEDMPPDELKLDDALEMLTKAEQGDEPIGLDPETKSASLRESGDDSDRTSNWAWSRGTKRRSPKMLRC